jgi:hypothetical protein
MLLHALFISQTKVSPGGLRDCPGLNSTDDDAIRAARDAAKSTAWHKRAADGRLIGAEQAIARLDEQLRAHRRVASEEQICTHCGQSIDPTWVASEILALEARLTEARAEQKAARAALALAEAEAWNLDETTVRRIQGEAEYTGGGRSKWKRVGAKRPSVEPSGRVRQRFATGSSRHRCRRRTRAPTSLTFQVPAIERAPPCLPLVRQIEA